MAMSVEQICERSLRKIGATAIRTSGARPEEVAETRYWLDMVIGHEASRLRTWWLIGSSGTFPIAPGIDSYDLLTALGDQATDGIQFPVLAILVDVATGQDIHELPLVRGEEWERRNLGPDTPADLDVSNPDDRIFDPNFPVPTHPPGTPQYCYVDRAQKPTLRCYPTPDASRALAIRLQFQSFPSDVTRKAPADKVVKLRTSMNLWIVTALAAQIANGPVRKLPADEIQDMKQEAQRLRDELEAYDWQEQANEPRRIAYFDGI